MYLVEEKAGEEARKAAAEAPPFGPGFTAEEAAKAEKIEVWGSEFNDPGPDFCEFRLFDSAGVQVASRQVAGY